jgi:hypothetical protein
MTNSTFNLTSADDGCECVRVCIYTHHIYILTYIYIYVCMYVTYRVSSLKKTLPKYLCVQVQQTLFTAQCLLPASPGLTL